MRLWLARMLCRSLRYKLMRYSEQESDWHAWLVPDPKAKASLIWAPGARKGAPADG